MAALKELFQIADWKTEKHMPVIDAPDKAKKGEFFKINLAVGKEIPHPNTTEHFIAWVEVYFHSKAEKFPYQVGRFEFTSHGASVQGPNTSTVFTHPAITLSFKTEKSGTILASSYCNIHGLWESTRELEVEG